MSPIDAGIRFIDAGLAVGPVIVPSPETNPADFFARVFATFNDHNWRYLAALCVVGTVYLVRLAFKDKIVALQHGKWAWTLAVVGAGSVALVTHLADNQPLGGFMGVVGAFLSGAFVGLAGAGAVKGATEWWRTQPETNATAPGTPKDVLDNVLTPDPDDRTRISPSLPLKAPPAAPPATPKVPPKK